MTHPEPGADSPCERVRDAFLAGGVPTDPNLVAHAKGCTECSLLIADEGELGHVLAASSADGAAPKWAGVGSLVRNDRGLRAWLRSRPTRQRLLMVLVAALTAVVLGGRHPRVDQPDAQTLGVWVLAFLATALVCAALALGSLGRLRSSRRRVLVAGVGLLLPLGYALTHQFAGDNGSVDMWPGVVRCFGYGTLLAFPLFGLVWLLDRDEKPALLTSVITGVAAGLAANAALSLHCAKDDAAHLLLGHAAIGAILGLVGAAFAAFLARQRSRG